MWGIVRDITARVKKDRLIQIQRDLGISLKGKERKRYESSVDLSVYNVYSRKNAYSIRFEEDEDDPTKTVAKKLSLFPIVPSITYNFKF